MAVAPLPDLILYTRAGCELCDEARDVAQGLLEDRAARSRPLAVLRERDVDADASLRAELGDRVPVFELRGRRLELAVSAGRLRRFLAENLDGVAATDRIA
jgi:hypothetical protein